MWLASSDESNTQNFWLSFQVPSKLVQDMVVQSNQEQQGAPEVCTASAQISQATALSRYKYMSEITKMSINLCWNAQVVVSTRVE